MGFHDGMIWLKWLCVTSFSLHPTQGRSHEGQDWSCKQASALKLALMRWSQTGPRSGNIKATLNNLLNLHFTPPHWTEGSNPSPLENKQPLLEIQSLCSNIQHINYLWSLLFKLRIFKLIFHLSYSSPAVRSQDSEQSYFSIFRETSPSYFYNIWVDNWQDCTQYQHSNFICCRERRTYLLHPTICSSAERKGLVP